MKSFYDAVERAALRLRINYVPCHVRSHLFKPENHFNPEESEPAWRPGAGSFKLEGPRMTWANSFTPGREEGSPEKELPCLERQEAATRAAHSQGGHLGRTALRHQPARTTSGPPSSRGTASSAAHPAGGLHRPFDVGRAFPGVRGSPPSEPQGASIILISC